MNERELMIILAISVPFFIGFWIHTLWVKKTKEKAEKQMVESKPVAEIEEQPEQVTEAVVQTLPPENPKIAALRGATRQSLILNIQQLDALRQMAEIAWMNCTDTTTRRKPQDDPRYRQAEWWYDDTDGWR